MPDDAIICRSPVALLRGIDLDAVCRDHPCDSVRLLGSFWPNSSTSFESHVVKGFKECLPAPDFEPHVSALCEFYAGIIAQTVSGKFDWVARVLGSAETIPDLARPQSLLEDLVCKRLAARSITQQFFKSESRPSMRFVKHLSGAAALEGRVRYALQDLFIKPAQLGGRVLLMDDIFNTGASMRAYAAALKMHAGVGEVHGVNLAATRFAGGRDGLGMLKLDVSALRDQGLQPVWLDKAGVFHKTQDCPQAAQPTCVLMHFMAARKGAACSQCFPPEPPRRKWWKFGG